MNIQTRTRTRRMDENAPPLTRASRSTQTVAMASKPTVSRTASTANATAASAKSSIPVMKRTNTSTSATSASTLKSRAAVLGEVTNAGKKAGALGDKTNKAREARPALGDKEKKPVVAESTALASKRTRGTSTLASTVVKVEEKPLISKRKAATTAPLPARSRSTTAEVKPLANRTANVKQEKSSQEEPARKRRKTSSPALATLDYDLVDEANYDPDSKEVLLHSGEDKGLLLRSPKRERAKDEGWEDLDADDEGDPSMVSEYVVDAFRYMLELEVSDSYAG